MEFGCVPTREIEKLCNNDIRFMWLLQETKAPIHMTIDNFMKDYLVDCVGCIDDKLVEYTEKLKKYAIHINTCGDNRNSYSKTDNDATFFRMKRDYMGNDQLLPRYNIQLGICDEYIAVFDVKQYASDMDCFVPLMERFKKIHGFYPK